MIRKMTVEAAIGIFLLLLAGCAEAPQRDYVSSAHGFGIDVPTGWNVQETDGDVVLGLLGPAGPEGQRPAVHILAVSRGGYTLKQWAKESMEINRLQYRELTLIRNDEISAPGPSPTRIIEFTERTVAGERRQRQLLLVSGGRAYAVLATAMASDF
ncbi:MAG: hypothetical protein QF662_07540, partial [Phycisphaerae bacterium]|nr:hypothetical protein [Phycisphaerae bacterium]